MLPETNLNVLYLNLFGTDRGNQWGYFSDNNKKINQITKDSEKVLISTTQLIDPGKLRQIQVIITPDGQVQNNTSQKQSLTINKDNIQVNVEDLVQYSVGKTSNYKWAQVKDLNQIQTGRKSTLRYLPEQIDSIIS
jgi:hypothetical protein